MGFASCLVLASESESDSELSKMRKRRFFDDVDFVSAMVGFGDGESTLDPFDCTGIGTEDIEGCEQGGMCYSSL